MKMVLVDIYAFNFLSQEEIRAKLNEFDDFHIPNKHALRHLIHYFRRLSRLEFGNQEQISNLRNLEFQVLCYAARKIH